VSTAQKSETDWRLRPIVGLLSFLAGICIVVAAGHLTGIRTAAWPTLFIIVVLLELSNLLLIYFGSQTSVSWTDSAILVAAAVLPLPWVVVSVAGSIAVGKLVQRRPPIKLLFAVSKGTIVAAVIGLIISSAHTVEPMTTTGHLDHFPRIEMLAAAFATMTVLDHVLSVPVMAISMNVPVLRMFRESLNRHLTLAFVRFAVAWSPSRSSSSTRGC